MENNWMEKLESGDLLLFEGSGMNSKLIRIFTESPISHAAIVYRCPITSQIYLWETGGDSFLSSIHSAKTDVNENSFPIITEKSSPYNASHLIPLYVKLRGNYNKKVYLKKLVCKRKKLDQLVFDLFVVTNMGKPYMANLVSLWTQRDCRYVHRCSRMTCFFSVPL